MPFNLFGLLPDPAEAERNAPQLPLDSNLLTSLQERLSGLDETQQETIRDRFRTATNRSVSDSRRSLDQVNNSATAIAGNQQLSRNQQQGLVDGEQLITEQDIQLRETAQDRFNQEFARQDERRAENKIAREKAREDAKLARKQIGFNLATSVLGAGISAVAGPEAGAGTKNILNSFGSNNQPTSTPLEAEDNVPDLVLNNEETRDVFTPQNDQAAIRTPQRRSLSGLVNGQITVQSGDTLSGIAERAGLTVEQLIRINGIQDPNQIEPGQLLRIVE